MNAIIIYSAIMGNVTILNMESLYASELLYKSYRRYSFHHAISGNNGVASCNAKHYYKLSQVYVTFNL